MTWTYVDPSNSDRDALRFLIGDTDTDIELITDEELDYILELYPTVSGKANWTAAAVASMAIAAGCAKKMTKTVGSLSIQWGDRYRNYTEMAADFEEKAQNGLFGTSRIGPPLLFGGGPTYLGPDDTPEDYFPTADSGLIPVEDS